MRSEPMPPLQKILNLKTLNNLLFLLASNFLGSWGIMTTYMAGTRIFKTTDVLAPSFDEAALFQAYVLHTYTTLLICAVFSISFLFLKDRMRYIFLAAPLVIPSVYGFFFLSSYQ
ncbi:MAG: hypothetical protein KDI90_02545 [Alphaproteobacteria bacterium]|nr:hypothetical protein [Alphaproteobacteria bacterium]